MGGKNYWIADHSCSPQYVSLVWWHAPEFYCCSHEKSEVLTLCPCLLWCRWTRFKLGCLELAAVSRWGGYEKG